MADTLKQEKIKHEDVAADGVQAKPTVNKTTKRDEAAPPVKNKTADEEEAGVGDEAMAIDETMYANVYVDTEARFNPSTPSEPDVDPKDADLSPRAPPSGLVFACPVSAADRDEVRRIADRCIESLGRVVHDEDGPITLDANDDRKFMLLEDYYKMFQNYLIMKVDFN